MTAPVTYVSGATGPPLLLTFERPSSGGSMSPIDLTGYTVTATIARPGLSTLTRTLTLVTPTAGSASLTWLSGDLVNTSQVMTAYAIDFNLTAPSGSVEVQPVPFQVFVRPSVVESPPVLGAPMTSPTSFAGNPFSRLVPLRVSTASGSAPSSSPTGSSDLTVSAIVDTGLGPSDIGAAYALIPTVVLTGSQPLFPGMLACHDIRSASAVDTLPAAPPNGTRVGVKIVSTNVGATNTVTVNCSGSDHIDLPAGTTSLTRSVLDQTTALTYRTSNATWTVVSDDVPLSQLDARYPLSTAVPGGDLGGTYAAPLVKNRARSATLVMAAANSSAVGKAAADYVCSGTVSAGGDETTFASVLAALPGNGGRIIMLEGTYWRDQPFIVDKDNVTLQGQGPGFGTTIGCKTGATASAAVIVGNTHVVASCTLADFAINGSGNTGAVQTGSGHGAIVACAQPRIRNVVVQYAAGDSFHLGQDLLTGQITSGPYTLSGSGQTIAATNVSGLSSGGGSFIAVQATNYVTVTYTGLSGTNILGCTGTGTLATGNSIGKAVFDASVMNTYSEFQIGTGYYMDFTYSSCELYEARCQGATTKPAVATTNSGFQIFGTQIKLLNCHSYWCGYGLYIGSSTIFTAGNITVIGGEWETNSVAGIFVTNNGAGGVTVIGSQFYGNGVGTNSSDVTMSFGAKAVHFLSCTFRQSGGTLTHQIYAQGASDCQIEACRFDYPFIGQCIFFDGEGGTAGVVSNMSITRCQARPGVNSSNFVLLKGGVIGCEISENNTTGSITEQVAGGFTPNWNRIHRNTMVDGYSLSITTVGPNTEAWENYGTADTVSLNSTTTAASPRKIHYLSATTGAMTLRPPGWNSAAIALAAGSVGVSLPVTTLALSSNPIGVLPPQGDLLVPVSGGGYQVVHYTSLTSSGCSGVFGGTGTTVSGSILALPDSALTFKAVVVDATNAVTVAVPTGMTVNGSTSALTLTAGKSYQGALVGTDWKVY